MENLPQLVPLIILIPALGAFINIFWGARLSERVVSIIGTTAAALAFGVALLLLSYEIGSGYTAVVVNPALLDGWLRIPSVGLEIPWQMRVDTLSVTMMLVVTGVGTLIHIYSAGYMHGDEKYSRFFAYLNTFLAFMLILVTGNNFLMMFVGWEGVGLCSFLLIGFWFDRARGVGWKNSLAARKAFIVNRVGDFGLILGLFLTFWTFGTLDYYRPGEIANPEMVAEQVHQASEGVPAEGAAIAQGEHTAVTTEGESAAHTETTAAEPVYTDNEHIDYKDLGVFGRAERLLALPVGDPARIIHAGPLQADIATIIGLITFLFLIGAAGKSAQIPLFIWLPDAMAGPTPVSALIHAATMVTAGVYMMVRSNVFYHAADFTSFIVTIIGVATALCAGYIAMGQWDIKKVLAYSTVSQLGFMVAAVGVGAYGAAMFHLVTHAFFKALLFLGSGSVIHGVEHGEHLAHEAHSHGGHGHDDAHAHGEEEADAHPFDPQDMRNMGGLRKRMPITYWTYIIGTLALAGIWPFAGFWSKDEILGSSWLAGLLENKVGGYIALGVLIVAAAFTAFYMWRQVEMVFHGEARTEAAAHAPESVWTMTLPLVVLAFFSCVAGLFNLPPSAGIPTLGLDHIFGVEKLGHFLEFSVVNLHGGDFQPLIGIIALALALGAIWLARSIYGFNHALAPDGRDPLQLNPGIRPFWAFSNAKMYWDETFNRLLEQPFNRAAGFLANTLDWDFWHDYVHETVIAGGYNAIAKLLAGPVDLGLIDWVVNGIGRLTTWLSAGLRQIQTGYVRTYAVTLFLGVLVVIVILLLPYIQQAAAVGK